jgi:hypothetical protein
MSRKPVSGVAAMVGTVTLGSFQCQYPYPEAKQHTQARLPYICVADNAPGLYRE